MHEQVLKLLAEMSPFCGDMDKLEANLNMLFTKLLVRMTVVSRDVSVLSCRAVTFNP